MGRAVAASFGTSDFLHPLDRSARQQLEAIPLLAPTVKKYLTAAADRKPRQVLLSGALRLGPRQLPDIYRMLPPICAAFGIPEPELYLMRGDANARTVGHDRPAIVIYNRLLEDLADDEVEAMLAHECGHILASHALYRQMAQALIRSAPPWPTWAGPGPCSARCSASWGCPSGCRGSAYLEQVVELDQISEAGRWDRLLAPDLENGSGHPVAALRIRELTAWADSDAFRRLTAEGEIARPAAAGRVRPRPRQSLADIVSEQRG
jgi:hypothetical protein